MTIDNNRYHYANETLKHLLNLLAENHSDLCVTQATRIAIHDALKSKEDDLITCLNELAKITTRLAIPRKGEVICTMQYTFQGNEALYDLLDSIRHEFRMLELDLADSNIVLSGSESTNNILYV
jgi:hypothetical protein